MKYSDITKLKFLAQDKNSRSANPAVVRNSTVFFKSIQEFLKSFNKSKQVNDYKDDYISSRLKRIQAARSFLFSKNDNEHTHFTYYGRTKHKVLFNE